MFSKAMRPLLSEGDLDLLSKELGPLLKSFPSSDVFNMVGRGWQLRAKAYNSPEPASHGFFSRETRAAGPRCWFLFPEGA